MPTPKSDFFKKYEPKVPATFEGVDFANNQQVIDARDAIIRENWVRRMMQRLVEDEMGKCYRREGVNHLENCGVYRDRYLQLLKDNRGVGGYMGQQMYYTPGVDGPAGGPEIKTDYPTPQKALGAKGTDNQKGNTSGLGGNTLY